MRTFIAHFQRSITQEAALSTYRDDKGAWLVIKGLDEIIRLELDDQTARDLGDALIGISKPPVL